MGTATMDLDNAQDSGMARPRAATSEARFQQHLEREVLRNERLRAQLLAWVCGFLMLFILGLTV